MSKIYFSHTTKFRIVKEGFVPAATIALKKEGNKFLYGVSICSKYDNFSKKQGRAVAEERLSKGFGELVIPDILKDLPEKEACLAQLYNLVSSVLIKSKKWKKKVTRFNLDQSQSAKVISITQ